MREPTVAAGVVRGLVDFAVSKGAGAGALFEQSGIGPADLQGHDNRIAFAKYVALMRAAKALCNDPALALHYGEAVALSEISIIGLIGEASETVIEAMAQINRYARLAIEVDTGVDDRFTMERRDGLLWLIDNRKNPNDFPELTESVFARSASGMRRLGEGAMLKGIHVSHPDPGYRAEYERILRAPVFFGSDRNAMLLDEVWLSHRIRTQPRYVFGILAERADALLAALESSKSTRGCVEKLLMPVMHTGETGMDAIAAKMGLSRQTLFRRLKAEGTTYEKVLDELRRRLALDYLGGKKTSVNETAYLVGFSDPAAFSRAFKRWTGRSPRNMRVSQ